MLDPFFFSSFSPFSFSTSARRKANVETEKGNLLDFHARAEFLRYFNFPLCKNHPRCFHKRFGYVSFLQRERGLLTYLSDANYEHVILSAESENSGEQMYKMERKKRKREREREKRDGFPGLIFRQLRAKRLVIF